MENKVYKIAEYVLDTQTRRFSCENEPIELSSRAFDILSYLIQRRGEIVDKDELLQAIWKDSFVEENNLAVHISALRRILNEKKGENRFIKTISGRGYCFIAPVKEIAAEAESYEKSNFSDAATIPASEKNSIAILNFTFDEFNAEMEYLANGLTQSLISDLSQVPNLKVMAYSAVRNYKNSTLDLHEIGFLLGVNKILTGHISEYKNKLAINIELVDTSDKSLLWGMQYDFEFSDLLEVKKNISLTTTEKLKLQFPDIKNSKTSRQKSTNSEGFRFYLKGKYILETISTRSDIKKDLNQAVKFFRNTLMEDSQYALAYVGIGEADNAMFHYNVWDKVNCYEEAKKALELALKLDDRLSEAHALRGTLMITFERNLTEAKKTLSEAINLNTNNPESYHWLAFVNMCFGDFKTAVLLQKKAVRLDPPSIRYNCGLLRILYFSGDYAKAITQAEEILELDGRSVPGHSFSALIYAQLKMFEKALIYIEKALELRPDPEFFMSKAYIHALAGNKIKTEKIISQVFAEFASDDVDFTALAAVYAALNEKDKAFAALNRAFQDGGSDLMVIKVNPKFKNLYGDKRFHDFLKKLNLV